MKNKYIVENKNGDWLHAFFSKEEAEECVKHMNKNEERMGKKGSYKIKTPDKLKIGKTNFPQDVRQYKFKDIPKDELIVVDTTVGVLGGKPIKHNEVLTRKNVSTYVKTHGVIVNGIRVWRGAPIDLKRTKKGK